jgi:hypothetical protein
LEEKKKKKKGKLKTSPFYYFDYLISKGKKIALNDSILIVGSPRSGTTWLMEIFESIPGYTYLFEPLQRLWFPSSIKIGFNQRPYLPPEENNPEYKEYLRKIFTGQIVSKYPPYGNNIEMTINRLFSKKLIVKSIRLTRLLPWIDKRFQLRNITYIIRHPCAVIASQIKTGFGGYQNDYPYTNRFPSKDMIIEEASNIDIIDSSIINKLKRIKTTEELLAAAWCLDNYVPLYFLDSHKWNMIVYEKLVTDGEPELRKLFGEIGEEDSSDFAVTQLKKPSMLTIEKDPNTVLRSDIQLSKWKKSLSKEQIKRILNIVEDFGLNFYTEKSEPDYDNIRVKNIK